MRSGQRCDVNARHRTRGVAPATAQNAVEYLKAGSPEVFADAEEYVRKAPAPGEDAGPSPGPLIRNATSAPIG